jgi:nucleoid DNA-binding protein
MTKQDVIQQIRETTGIDPLKSRSIGDAFVELVQASLSKGESIYIRTFGRFILKRRLKKWLVISARIQPSALRLMFKPSLELTNR